ncbi:Alpha/beta hydrolase family protein [Posidoniimonas corsicana]|uniref:Alpha/beta hydrolase family protein n=1 Tax=Posidoniimonas corsicana TaxID=1938618 RepID=A0A5C5V789_9BACT|nr:prolyl oligopeptidase family serine peptidase [Posidoniimonas corsicana]TWT33677.1 Alpha/beta hydrolase family protein [Posidoniimonas corsicana]
MKPRIRSLMLLMAAANATGAEPLDLPHPLQTTDGRPVTSAVQWRDERRPELLELFRTHVYGRAPIERPEGMRWEVTERDPHAMADGATLSRVAIRLPGTGGEAVIRLTLFVPNRRDAPAPGFLLICNRDPENIDPTRQEKSPFWPAEHLVERGYFAAAFHYADVDPDHHDGFQNGVHGLFDEPDRPRPADAWGSIAAWAWGASRVMDYLQTRDDVDHDRIGVVGHSRGGKTALWCGAEDQRFAMVVSNNSGCTGAALARRKHGERVARINKSFPHWFCENYNRYNDNEDALPVDQHELIALVAPRLAYVASASEDDWADPEGEFLAAVHAGPVYRLLGAEGVGAGPMPPPERPRHAGRVGYHLRSGGHDLTEYDWGRFMDFADRHWRDR